MVPLGTRGKLEESMGKMVFEWDLYGIYGNAIFFPAKLGEFCGSYQPYGVNIPPPWSIWDVSQH
jgi:hypothetical protein